MKLRYLETAKPGLAWMKRYFHSQPQLDRRTAFENFEKAKAVLKQFPLAGELFDDFANVREFHIARSAFAIIYTQLDDTIFVIDIRDTRGLRSAAALQSFARELKAKYRI